MRRRYPALAVGLSLALLWIVGCIPVTTPPQLAYTPGPPVVVDAVTQTVDFGMFSATVPAGWRVITGEAAAAPSAIFAAPDDAALIYLTTVRQSEPPLLPDRPSGEHTLLRRRIRLDTAGSSLAVYIWLVTPIRESGAWLPALEQVMASVQPQP